jgi:hypothetical protein
VIRSCNASVITGAGGKSMSAIHAEKGASRCCHLRPGLARNQSNETDEKSNVTR